MCVCVCLCLCVCFTSLPRESQRLLPYAPAPSRINHPLLPIATNQPDNQATKQATKQRDKQQGRQAPHVGPRLRTFQCTAARIVTQRAPYTMPLLCYSCAALRYATLRRQFSALLCSAVLIAV